MALYDRADLVRRFRRHAKRPATDQAIDVTDIYAYLSDAQRYVHGQLSLHVPEANQAAKELMTTSDDGLTYDISTEPVGPVTIYYDLRSAQPLTPVEPWQLGGDFEWDGLTTIRMVGNTARKGFTDGAPYAHYVPVPADIDADNEPTILPKFVRILIPIRAAMLYMSEGGLGNTSHMDSLYQRHWSGDPLNAGDIGILGELKIRFDKHQGGTRPWWRSPDLSNLPVGFNS